MHSYYIIRDGPRVSGSIPEFRFKEFICTRKIVEIAIIAIYLKTFVFWMEN